VSSKCSLAARVDNFHESSDGDVGNNMRAEIEQKLDKLLEPPPVKQIKPLAAPIDPARKKRGGRRLALSSLALRMSSMHQKYKWYLNDSLFGGL